MVLIGVSFYMVAMLAIGYWSSKRIKNFTDFLVAGRKLSYPLATATLFATWFGAGTCMGAAGTAYSEGFLGVVADPFAAGLSLIIAGFFYVALLRRLRLLTVTDLFGRYYGKGAEIFASLLMVPAYIGWLGSQMVAVGYILNTLTGLNAQLGIILAALVVVVYTIAGGMWAVTLTDVVQAIILIAGLLFLFPIVLSDVGGLGGLIEATPQKFWRLIPEDPDLRGWISYTGQWAICGLGCVVGQDLIQRSLSSRTESIARTSAVTAGVLYVVIGLIPVLLGLCGRFLLPELEDPEYVIPSLALRYLTPFGMTIFLGALISMIMSSADSSLLAGTSLVTNNILLRLWPTVGSKNVLPLARVVTVVLAIFSMCLALYVKQIYGLMINSWATLFVGLLVPVTAALYWRKANGAAAWSSMVIGTATWAGFIFLQGSTLEAVVDPIFYEAAVCGGVASLVSYLVVTALRYRIIEPTQPASEFRPA